MTPLVPPFIQHVIQQKADPLAYIPTRASLGWRYSSYTWNATTKQLTVRVHDKHYKLSNTNHTIAIISTSTRNNAAPFCSRGSADLMDSPAGPRDS